MNVKSLVSARKRTEGKKTDTPRIATFFPGPILARTIGLQTVRPAHISGAASLVSMLSGILKVKCS